MKTHYSVAELLDLHLSDLPKTRKGLDKYLLRNNWKYKEVSSRGIGGTRKEYEPPAEFMQQIVNQVMVSSVKETTSTEIVTVEDSHLSTENAAELANWQRETAENRLFIVRYLQQQVKQGKKKTPLIEQFVLDAQALTLSEEVQGWVLKANAKSGGECTVSIRTLKEWVKLVEYAEKRKVPVIAALAPKARRTEIPAWAEALLKLWGQPQKPALAAVLELLPNYLKAGQVCPSYNQAYRFINEKLGNVEAQRGRMGSRDIKNIKPFIRRDTEMLLPSDVYTADGHKFDAEVAHPLHGKAFRPEITAIIDVATRRLVGWSIDLAESGFAVLDAIRMSACECGIPAIFYVDNGSGYKNQLLGAKGRGVMARLNTEMSHALPYNSQAKGLIERSHQSIWIRAAKQLPTYIGADMDAEASNKAHKITRKDLALFGQSKALISWQDFLLFAADVVDQYNNRPHSSLRRITDPVTMKKRYQSPLEAWNEALEMGAPIDRVEDWDKEDLFRPYEERKVRRGEIELFGNRYFSAELTEYHCDTVLVGYDIHNADRLTVRDEDGRFICHAHWNANKRAYFPQSKVEQNRQRRADGRLRRLAVKQEEVKLEASPRLVIEHMQDQTIIPFNSKREELMQELVTLPVVPKDDGVFFKEKLNFDADAPVEFKPENKVERWIALDEQICRGEDVAEQDRKFWKLFPNSKTFTIAEGDDAVLKQYLAQRQA